MLFASLIAIFGVLGACASIVVARRLIPPYNGDGSGAEGLRLEEVAEIHALRAMVLQQRLELATVRRDAIAIRRQLGTHQDRRSRDLEQRQLRARAEALGERVFWTPVQEKRQLDDASVALSGPPVQHSLSQHSLLS